MVLTRLAALCNIHTSTECHADCNYMLLQWWPYLSGCHLFSISGLNSVSPRNREIQLLSLSLSHQLPISSILTLQLRLINTLIQEPRQKPNRHHPSFPRRLTALETPPPSGTQTNASLHDFKDGNKISWWLSCEEATELIFFHKQNDETYFSYVDRRGLRSSSRLQL